MDSSITITENKNPDIWRQNLSEYNYSLFMLPEWIEAIKNINLKPLYLDFYSNEVVVAKISGFSCQSKSKFKKKLFFYSSPAIKKELSKEITDHCIRSLVKYARLKENNRVVILSYDSTFYYDKGNINGYGCCKRYEYQIDLSGNKDEVLNKISRGIKKPAKKAENTGLSFIKSDSEEYINKLFELLEETKKRRISKGYSNYNPFYFPYFTKESMIELLKRKVIGLYIVKKEADVWAIQIVFEYDHKAYALFLGSKQEGYKSGVPAYIDLCTINRLKDNNYEYFNMGGVPSDKTHSGIAHFKKLLGANEQISTYGSTNFLLFPYTFLNPIVICLRKFSDSTILNFIKKISGLQ